MQDEQFDAVVIGSGQGGNPLAKAMAKHGWKTAVIERRYPGGTCVNDGCTPSKTIDASARVAYLARRGADFGVHTGPVSVDLAKVWERKQKLVLAGRENNGKALSEAENCELLMGEARFCERQPGGGVHALNVRLNDGGERRLIAPRVFLNTGERPHPPELEGLDNISYLDSTSVMELKEVPEHLLVLGAGYIALEFAQMFLRFGAKVTVLERGERLVAQEDEDVAQCLREILTEDGIEIITCTAVTRAGGGAGSVRLQVEVDGVSARADGITPSGSNRTCSKCRGARAGACGCKAGEEGLCGGKWPAGDECAGHLGDRRCEGWAGVHACIVRRLPDSSGESARGRVGIDGRPAVYVGDVYRSGAGASGLDREGGGRAGKESAGSRDADVIDGASAGDG